jgi:hypothetical protein
MKAQFFLTGKGCTFYLPQFPIMKMSSSAMAILFKSHRRLLLTIVSCLLVFTSAQAASVIITDARYNAIKTVLSDTPTSLPTSAAYTGPFVTWTQNNYYRGNSPSIDNSTYFQNKVFLVVPRYGSTATQQEQEREAIAYDAQEAFQAALYYRMNPVGGYSQAGQTAQQLINAWSDPAITIYSNNNDLNTAQTALTLCIQYAPFIWAADLLRGTKYAVNENNFENFLNNTIYPVANTLRTDPANNNGVDWALLLYTSIAAFENTSSGTVTPSATLSTAVTTFQTDVNNQIDHNGYMNCTMKNASSDITRNDATGVTGSSGIWYSNFALMALTYTAEILHRSGYEEFDYTNIWHTGLQKAFVNLAQWDEDPSTFVYYSSNRLGWASQVTTEDCAYLEILNDHWANADAMSLFLNGSTVNSSTKRPFQSDLGLSCTTLIHSGFLFEAESLTIASLSPGTTTNNNNDPDASGGVYNLVNSTATGNYVTYKVPNLGIGAYTERIGYQDNTAGGIWQNYVAPYGSSNFVKQGLPTNTYNSSSAFFESDLGTLSLNTSGSPSFQFTVTNKEPLSAGYTMAFDYILLIPQF